MKVSISDLEAALAFIRAESHDLDVSINIDTGALLIHCFDKEDRAITFKLYRPNPEGPRHPELTKTETFKVKGR